MWVSPVPCLYSMSMTWVPPVEMLMYEREGGREGERGGREGRERGRERGGSWLILVDTTVERAIGVLEGFLIFW